jgi:hypothetical protein
MKTSLTSMLMATALAPAPLLPVHADMGVSVEFSTDEVNIISAWYREHGVGTPTGKKGRG